MYAKFTAYYSDHKSVQLFEIVCVLDAQYKLTYFKALLQANMPVWTREPTLRETGSEINKLVKK